jgi:D-tyrosyl-tRNA(Tyr) deacylase
MIAVLQRVSSARVTVASRVVGAIDAGLVVLVGAVTGDSTTDIEYVEKRVATLRVFADEVGRMNRSVDEIGGAVLVVSQFTLVADTRKGRRPSFGRALAPNLAAPMIETLVARLRARNLRVETGEFGASMAVELVNDGPVTLVVDSRSTGRGRSVSSPRST